MTGQATCKAKVLLDTFFYSESLCLPFCHCLTGGAQPVDYEPESQPLRATELMQGKRAALPSTSIMLRQPYQRFTQMQASDVDIYRNEIRKAKGQVVCGLSFFKPLGGTACSHCKAAIPAALSHFQFQ